MTEFIDGPAKGVVLSLKRAPLFLRVVQDTGYAQAVCKKGRREWDALDQLDDTPRRGETVHVYVRVSDDGHIHINSRDRKTGRHTGGFFALATYRHHDEQPDDATARETVAWQRWAHEQAARLKGPS